MSDEPTDRDDPRLTSEGPFWTFLVFVDRRELPHVTMVDAQQYVSEAIDAQARVVDLSDDDTLKLIARSVTVQPIDLIEEGERASENLRWAVHNAKVDAEVAHARRVPALVEGAKLDALIAVYARELRQRSSVVILVWDVLALTRRWWRQRRAGRAAP